MSHFQVSQTLKMAVPNEAISLEQYLRQPQRLVQAITDPTRMEQLTPSRFRLKLRPLQFMSFKFEPIVDLQVCREAEGTVHLRSLDYELRGAEFLSQSFHLELDGKLSSYSLLKTTELRGKADLKVKVDVPPPLNLLPKAVLEKSGNAFLNGILLTIRYRLERQLVDDYRRWVKANLAGVTSSPITISPEGSLAG